MREQEQHDRGGGGGPWTGRANKSNTALRVFIALAFVAALSAVIALAVSG